MTDTPSPAYELDALKNLTNYYTWIFEESVPFLGSRIAEIGGGIGTFTSVLVHSHVLRHSTRSLEVMEPDPALYPVLVDRLQNRFHDLVQADRLRMTNGTFTVPPRPFDSIVMINVLEHIQDDEALLRTIHRSLAPGGTVIVFVPALQQLFSPLDKAAGHFRRYEKSQLRHILESSGFHVATAIYMDMAGVIPWYLIHVLGGSRTINARMARFYDRWGVPITKFIERCCGAPLGKNLLMIGQKP